MNTDGHGSAPDAVTHAIIGSAFEVLNHLGHGFHEKPYERALVVELGLGGIACDQQLRFPICYKDVLVHEYIPDLVVAKSVVVGTKVIDRITDHERGRMINYLRIAKLRVGLILNFHRAKLEWERIVL
jgi:GxxExxY protein